MKDTKIATILRDDLGAENCGILYAHQKTPFERYYIEYVIDKPIGLENNKLDSSFVASFCAIKLFRGLSSNTLKKNDGINIIIGNSNKRTLENFTNPKYFFSINELEIVNKSVNNVQSYIYSLPNNNNYYTEGVNFVDTNFCNLDSLSLEIKRKIDYYKKLDLNYGFFDYKFKPKNNIILDCRVIVVIIHDKYDPNKEFGLKLMTRKTDDKIIDYIILE